MKNETKMATANKVLEFAKAQGFTSARIQLLDENGDTYDSPLDAAQNYGDDETVSISIDLILDDHLEFTVIASEDPEEDDVTIQYA